MGLDGVVGDPAGMRAYAAQLRQLAGMVATLAADVRQDVDGLTFEGPAATAFRGRLAGWQTATAGALNALADAADALARGAGQVEAEQAAAAARRAREQREAEERAAQERAAQQHAQGAH